MKQPIEASEAKGNIVLDIILSILTCGIYSLIWQARLFKAVNAFLGEEKYGFWKWFLLTLITCSIYNVIAQYEVARSINKIQAERKLKVNENLPLLSIVLNVLGLHIASSALQQIDINAWFGDDK